MTYVFVYGTLKKKKGNHHYLRSAIYLGEAVTNEASFTMFNGGFPFVSDHFPSHERSGRIVGELYQVDSQETLDRLDQLEGVPVLYVKREVEVSALSGLPYTANIYVASRGSNERLSKREPMKPIGRLKLLEWK